MTQQTPFPTPAEPREDNDPPIGIGSSVAAGGNGDRSRPTGLHASESTVRGTLS